MLLIKPASGLAAAERPVKKFGTDCDEANSRMFSQGVACWAIGYRTRERIMLVGLRKAAIETTELDPNLKAVLLFSLGGLTLSLYLLHLFSSAMVDAMMLLASAG
jgi:hypothetical protein